MMGLVNKLKEKIINAVNFSQEKVITDPGEGMTLGKLLSEASMIPNLNTPIEVCAFWTQGSFRANGVFFDGKKIIIYVEERRNPRDDS